MSGLKRYGPRIVIGLVLVATLYTAMTVWIPYRREQRIAQWVDASEKGRGFVRLAYFGPDWVPDSMRQRLPIFDRIDSVYITGEPETAAKLLPELRSATHLEQLYFVGNDTSDDDLQYLAHLTELRTLDLSNTKITDQGLKHLSRLQKLERLELIKPRRQASGSPNSEV